MMYESKMALAVKSKNRVLRESRDGDSTTVYLPFGCEYSLMLKNLNSVRAIAKIWIDGTDVTEGTSGLIIPPNDHVDLERYIKNGNLSAGNKFKFIERTRQVSNHRGNKIDDGLIRVEFEFERQSVPIVNPYPVYRPWDRSLLGSTTSYTSSPTMDSWTASYNASSESGGGAASISDTVTTSTASASAQGSNTVSSNSAFINHVGDNMSGQLRSKKTSMPRSVPQVETDVGITVPGAVSGQSFTWGAWFPTDGVKHVMIMQMLGEVEGAPVKVPVTVNLKPQCTSCGKMNKANAKFCIECGTALTLIGGYEARAC